MKQNSSRTEIKRSKQNETKRNKTDKRKQNEECSKMNRSNDNFYTASGVAQDKNFCVRALGRETRLKNKLHSPPQVDRNWKPINAFATRLGRQTREAHSICSRVGPCHRLCLGILKDQLS